MKGCTSIFNIFLAGSLSFAVNASEPESISLAVLESSPALYNNKLVRVTGVLELNFEGNTICDYSAPEFPCVLIIIQGERMETEKNHSPINGKAVVAEGKFVQGTPVRAPYRNKNEQLVIQTGGGMNSIKNVTRLEGVPYER